MTQSRKYAVIVDGYSAGNLLAPEFRSREIPVLHVQSTPTIWPILLPTFRESDYERNIIFDGDLEKVVEELRQYPLSCILPGTETGVEMADALSERLELPTNGTRRSEARRNKYLMVEAVRAAGVPAAKQLKTSNAAEVVAWAQDNGLQKIVVKPLKSAGTDGVAVCTTTDQIENAVRAIVGTVNKLGIPNDEVLAQEFLSGTEYFINTVSREGKHHFTEIWRYKKRSINGHDCVYDCNQLLPYDGEVSQALREYVLGVLGALEISYGPAHTEVIITPRGPVLVESGARLDGLSVPSVNNAAVGYGPVDLTVDAFLDPVRFEQKAAQPYPLLKHALTVYLTSYEAGTVRGIPGEARLRALPSFFQMRLRVKDGSAIGKTTNYFTAPGFLTLVHEDPAVLRADYDTIRGLEQGNLFDIIPA